MRELIQSEIKKYVSESPDNWLDAIKDHYFDEPIIQFADADDPLFEEYKTIIGQQHMTPAEAFEMAFGTGSYQGGTVISIVLPINSTIIKSNRLEGQPSQEWALLRHFGDIFRIALNQWLAGFLTKMGYRTVSPALAEGFKISSSDSGPISNWSERHIAFAAGLGSFSINDGFISEKGIAIRLLSVVTELKLDPDLRTAKVHTANCLLCSKGSCGACIRRCPVQAISRNGHDKMKCLSFVYSDESRKLAEFYGGSAKVGAGCGLCQTKVPCESKNPLAL